LVFRVWVKRCKEPGEIGLDAWTLVPYVSRNEIWMDAKSRHQVVANLLKQGCGVYGGTSPVRAEVIHALKRLHGMKLERSTLNSLQQAHINSVTSGSFVFCDSRNYREVLFWLRYEISRGGILRRDKMSWKQKRRKLGSLWRGS
jgi:hypothetical protein